ncbi:MAG TPA: GDYXXLXY domain-containing protein [Rhizobacter sp.]|nr:GDYXXLXY domain-containing protein [Rhizobacter sp.]
MADRLPDTIARAIATGLLPAEAAPLPQDARPWPVVLLTALGAWLAAIPLLIVVGMLLGDLVTRSVGPYIVGLLVLAAALVVLRSRELPLFVEQLAVPALLVGGGSLAFGVLRDLPPRGGALVLAAVALAIALAVDRAWLRVLLGALMAGLVGFALLEPRLGFSGAKELMAAWLAGHGLLLIWALALALQRHLRDGAALTESLAAGWLLVTLFGLAWLAGMSFLVGGALGGNVLGDVARELGGARQREGGAGWVQPMASALFAAAGALLAARAWPLLRQPVWALVGVVVVALAWLLPTLGGVGLALALSASTQRWRLAAVAGVAAAWVIGSFYYQLAWPLASKAALLAGAGAVLGVLAWWLLRGDVRGDVASAAPPPRGRAAGWLAGGTVATLAVASFAIWQKQDVIAHGQPVFVELAPVDPRSLMQGDYMALNFRLPDGVWKLAPPGVLAGRPRVLARRDARGVATLVQVAAPGQAPLPDELLIQLAPKNGRWALVTDAWFFREGEGERWAKAKYGEFRVAPDGRALLVGMADADLKPIQP